MTYESRPQMIERIKTELGREPTLEELRIAFKKETDRIFAAHKEWFEQWVRGHPQRRLTHALERRARRYDAIADQFYDDVGVCSRLPLPIAFCLWQAHSALLDARDLALIHAKRTKAKRTRSQNHTPSLRLIKSE